MKTLISLALLGLCMFIYGLLEVLKLGADHHVLIFLIGGNVISVAFIIIIGYELENGDKL